MILIAGKDLSTLSKNKIIWLIDKMFCKYFNAILSTVLLKYLGVPVTRENLYWEFMYHVPQILIDFSDDHKQQDFTDTDLKTYLGTRLRYFAYANCQAWKRKRHEVLNQAISYDDEITAFERSGPNYVTEFELNDSQPSQNSIDLTTLSDFEAEICKDYFIDGASIKSLMEKHQKSRYRLMLIIKSIQFKLRAQASASQKTGLENP